jgi:RimJ/RimL family protein N-acetyltransferase
LIHEIEITKNDGLLIDCLFPEALAVMQGNNPGWVFVDDPDHPREVLVWAQGIQGFYLAGDTGHEVFLEELDAYTDRVLKPRLHNLGIDWFEISGGEKWDQAILSIFQQRKLESSLQLVYTLRPTEHAYAVKPEPITGCELRRIDRHLLGDPLVGDRQFLFSKLIAFWGSAEAFFKTGCGFVLMEGERVASLCFSGFVAGFTHAVEIETQLGFRRRGYAEMAARAYISECLQKRQWLHWDCMDENTASARLAEKLGFTRSNQYRLYSFML